jgi:hypothetical protein
MTFASPIALILTALALPIIALYILKVRLRKVPVSTNLFWQQVCEEKPPRSMWKHFRHLSSLLLQLLMLLLLVLAVADPYFAGQLLQNRRIVLVIDNSASMRATDVTPTRLQAARSAAHDFLNGLRFRDEVAVIAAHGNADVVIGMTDHLPTLRDAIDAIDFTDGPTSNQQSIELARQLIGNHPHGHVLVFTDGCPDAAEAVDRRDSAETLPSQADQTVAELSDEKRPPGPTVEYRLFGTDVANVGITQLQIRRSLVDPLGYEILAEVRNASPNSVRCRLELTLNEIAIDVVPLKLQPEEVWSRSFEKTSLEGGVIHAELTQFASLDVEPSDDPTVSNAGEGTKSSASNESSRVDAANQPELSKLDLDRLDTDNSAWAILPERVRQQVLIVSPGNLFLQKVFEANPLIEVDVRTTFPDKWPDDGIIVLHGKMPSTLPDGNVFVLDPTGNCDHWKQGSNLDNPIVTELDKSSPLMTHIQLDNVVVPNAKQLEFQSPPHALATTISGDILYAEVKRPNGRCLVLSIDLESSDLTFRTAFPILVANALTWFSNVSGEWQPSLATGEISNFTAITGASAVSPSTVLLRDPAGRKSNAAVFHAADNDTARIALGPWQQTGVWTIEASATPVSGSPVSAAPALNTSRSFNSASESSKSRTIASIAVNLASDRETDLRPSKEQPGSAGLQSTSSGWFNRPFWFYLVLLACILTSVEWFLYQRRFIA